ncbi:MAG: hypothetical protein CVT48_03890 [Thermoplasmata archaeon HGW-Thermoplasmata-1]|nr:MAG: hypothetical protein CVT48_03890 [Thermoplasmata archaeon HGW-Thermoplasmata-1]
MKRIIGILIIAAMLAASFAGCVDSNEAPDTEEPTDAAQEPLNPNDILFTVPGKKAVMVIGGGDAGSNNARYWNDECWMYEILVNQYNYSKENVCVLYADGEPVNEDNCPDPGSAVEYELPINYPANKTALREVCDKLALNMLPEEQFYFWANDHGSFSTEPNVGHVPAHCVVLCLWEENIKDCELAGDDYLGKVKNYSNRIIFMKQCFSGGFIDDLSAEKTVICTACTDGSVSFGGASSGGYPYGMFSFYFQAALSGAYPDGTPADGGDADADADGKVSIKEAFDYAFAKEFEYGEGLTAAELPQYDDNANGLGTDPTDGELGSGTFL